MKLLEIENILESIQDALIIIDIDWNVKYVNQAFVDLSKRPSEEYLYKNFWDMFPRAQAPKISTHYKIAFEQKITQRFEEYFETLNLWTELSVSPLKNGGIMIIIKDISERKLLEQERLLNEKSLSELADSMPQIVWTSLPDGTINYYNKQWYDYTGFDKNLIGDQSWEPILHPEDVENCKNNWYSAVTSGEPYEMEYRFKDRFNEGNYRWFLGRALPIKDDYGKVVKWIGTCTDITDLKANEEAFKNSENQIRFLANSVPQMVWTATKDGQLDYVNQRTIDFHGCSLEEIIGDKWQNSIHPDDLPHCIKIWEHSLKTGNIHQVEMRIKNFEGKYIWYLARAIPYYVDGEIIKWFGTSTDIDLQKKNEQLKDEFISIASHELKTPLTTVKGYLQLLQKIQSGNSKEHIFIKKCLDNLFKLETLVKDLLDTSKINSNKITFNFTAFQYHELIKELLESLQATHINHQFIIQNLPEVMLTADVLRIEQVLNNFISNGIKYSPTDNRILIDVQIRDNEVITCIQDYGIGIAKENHEKLFDKFYRVDHSSLKYQGMGLGLYISSEIIRKHQGKLWIDSDLNKGTKIYFSLPI